jgi:positive control factor
MRELIKEYKKTLRLVRKIHKRATRKSDREYLSSMINDLRFVIEWLETGRMPGNYRGIERRAAYEREIPVDPTKYNFDLYGPLWPNDGHEMAEEDAETFDIYANEVLARLSEREREAWEMRYIGLLECREIAEIMGIHPEAVRSYIQRANRKLGKL